MTGSHETLRLGVLHYHWRPCGVRTVVRNALAGLIARGPYRRLRIDLISCDADGPTGRELGNALQTLAAERSDKEITIRTVEIPELGYDQSPAASREELFAQSQRLADRLRQTLPLDNATPEPYVLWTHNVNLGKNPRLTLAIALLAKELDRRCLPAATTAIVQQVHDFAEDQRPDCWAALRDCSGTSDPDFAAQIMYPASERILWLTLNSTDQAKLTAVGLPPDRVRILPNAVDVEALSAPPLRNMANADLAAMGLEPADFAALLREHLARYARQHGYRFEPDRRILLSPIKALRRKNVAESVLLTMLLNARQDRYQLVVTLPPAGDADRACYDALAQLVRTEALPVVLGVGEELVAGTATRRIHNTQVQAWALVDLLDAAEAVVTTSVQEGFGYVFHEPWLAGKALVGRAVPQVTVDFTAAGLELRHLYQHLLVPQDLLANHCEQMLQAYTRLCQTMRQAMGLASCPLAALDTQVRQQKLYRLADGRDEKDYCDWPDLPWPTQLHILQELARDPSLLSHLRPTDQDRHESPHWYVADKSGIIGENSQTVASRYGAATITHALVACLELAQTLARSNSRRLDSAAVSNRPLLEHAVTPAALRLLTAGEPLD